MIEIIVHPTGDRAEAEDWPSARVAASTMKRDARQNGAARPTVSYIVDGVLTPRGRRPRVTEESSED